MIASNDLFRSRSELQTTLGKQLSGPVMLYGEGWEKEQASIQSSMGHTVIVTVPTAHMKPSAVSIGLAGMVDSKGESGPVLVSAPFIYSAPRQN